jgi:hypothetical protein
MTLEVQNRGEPARGRGPVWLLTAGSCVLVACSCGSRLDLASSGLHMWFSPSMTLAKRQREGERIILLHMAQCRLIKNC